MNSHLLRCVYVAIMGGDINRFRLILSLFAGLHLTPFRVLAVVSFSQHSQSTNNARMQKIQRANVLSQSAANNISAAHEACELWSEILDEHAMDGKSLSPRILALSLVLQASCLVRVGEDEEAVVSFNKVQKMQEILDDETREKIILGKASSLQRLLKYQEALECFSHGSSDKAIYGAVTCSVRMGNSTLALNFMRSRTSYSVSSPIPPLLETLNWLMGSKLNHSIVESSTSPAERMLGEWIMALENTEQFACLPNLSAAELAQINIGPFDDPLLFNLDDKILLHRLLGGMSFWPHGIVIPDDTIQLKTTSAEYVWMKKKRSGYGSHGNEIVYTSQVLDSSDTFLLQRLIHPSYLLPPGRRKFSIRVYVAYFLPMNGKTEPDVFLSQEGLVKLAARPMDENDDVHEAENAVFMTNSGRDMDMKQENLSFLEAVMNQRGDSFELLWSNISAAVRDVMKAYHMKCVAQTNVACQAYRASLGCLAIPKVLGFDFVVDSDCHPWLVEVNRFPGMEPRDSVDSKVKNKALKEAWVVAVKRLHRREGDLNETSFQKLIF